MPIYKSLVLNFFICFSLTFLANRLKFKALKMSCLLVVTSDVQLTVSFSFDVSGDSQSYLSGLIGTTPYFFGTF